MNKFVIASLIGALSLGGIGVGVNAMSGNGNDTNPVSASPVAVKVAAEKINTAVATASTVQATSKQNNNNDDDNDDKKPFKSLMFKVDDDVSKKDKNKVKISFTQAKQAALKLFNGTIEDIELEKDNGRLYYHVDFKNTDDDFDVYVDAITGKAWQTDDDDDDKVKVTPPKKKESTSTTKPSNKQQYITKDKAVQIALNKVAGTVTEVELDNDDNRYEYEIEIKTTDGREVKIDVSAKTGKILKVDWEDED
ncbi:PepSY domain-containing protein [Paenibacillus sp. 481]|uniref:PepSY domain-containing protein n=1 Tax=Paenibacillus sp. 481 TaxID=2835869 RepID=UPI001E4A9A5F|nr:PepSY domain-containing protein [Paenibacillus sp. 481]UHA72202.1 PepSY domain-containing protein [Paenibacillus sp. 481]